MNNTAKALILSNIETYVDTMIARGFIKSENRDKTIQEYKIMAKIA